MAFNAGKNPFLFTDEELQDDSADANTINPFLINETDVGETQVVQDNPFFNFSNVPPPTANGTQGNTNPFAFIVEPEEVPQDQTNENNFLFDDPGPEPPSHDATGDLLGNFEPITTMSSSPQAPTDLLLQNHLVDGKTDQTPRRPPPPRPVIPPSKETKDLILTVTGHMEATSSHLDRCHAARTPSPTPMRDIHSPSPTPDVQHANLMGDEDITPIFPQTLPETNHVKPAAINLLDDLESAPAPIPQEPSKVSPSVPKEPPKVPPSVSEPPKVPPARPPVPPPPSVPARPAPPKILDNKEETPEGLSYNSSNPSSRKTSITNTESPRKYSKENVIDNDVLIQNAINSRKSSQDASSRKSSQDIQRIISASQSRKASNEIPLEVSNQQEAPSNSSPFIEDHAVNPANIQEPIQHTADQFMNLFGTSIGKNEPETAFMNQDDTFSIQPPTTEYHQEPITENVAFSQLPASVEPKGQNVFANPAEDLFDAFSAKFDSVKITEDTTAAFDPFGGSGAFGDTTAQSSGQPSKFTSH